MSTRRKAQHHNADYWRTHISACEESDLTQQQYCQTHQLTISTYYNWKKKLLSASGNQSIAQAEPFAYFHETDHSIPLMPISHQPFYSVF